MSDDEAGGCADLAPLIGLAVPDDGYLPAECCSSCHEDGDDDFEREHEGRRFLICCWMVDRLEDWEARVPVAVDPTTSEDGEKPPDGSETYLDPGDIPSPLLLDRSKDTD